MMICQPPSLDDFIGRSEQRWRNSKPKRFCSLEINDQLYPRRLLAVTLRPRDRAMVLVLLRTGMRIGELLHTTLADVNLAERHIEIVETQKNRVGRAVYLAEDAIEYISRIHQTDPSKPIFIKYAPGATHADSGDF